MRIALAAFAAMLVAPMSWAADQQSPKADASHRRAICGEIKKLDLALYDNAKGHGATATCSYTDDRLLIKPISELSEARMKRFVFLAFVTTGTLRNDDYMLPEKVYVGFGTQCQVMTTNDAASVQRSVKFGGDSGMANGYLTAMGAPKVLCPK